MRTRGVAAWVLVGAVGVLLLAGCTLVVPPPGTDLDSTLDFEKVVFPNAEPDATTDFFPLAVGMDWLYRDATADHLPTHPPGPPIRIEVAAQVVSADGTELYVLRRTSPGEPDEFLYLHRANGGVYAYGASRGGTTEVSPSPILWCPLPLEREETWTYTIDGEVFQARALFQEAVPTRAGVFQGCWKVAIESATTHAAEARWYASGVGLTKFTGGSQSYELERSSLTSGRRVLVPDVAVTGAVQQVRVGDAVIVALPAKQGSGYAWTRMDASDEFLRGSSQAGEFFPDLSSPRETDPGGVVSGTFVYRADAAQTTLPGVPALLQFAYVPITGGATAYSFVISIGVDP